MLYIEIQQAPLVENSKYPYRLEISLAVETGGTKVPKGTIILPFQNENDMTTTVEGIGSGEDTLTLGQIVHAFDVIAGPIDGYM